MKTRILNASLICLLLATTGACDKSPDPPGQAQQEQRDAEGRAWRGLLQGLDAAQTDESKVRLLERFIENNPEHPDVSDAKRRLEDVKNNPDAQAKQQFAATVQKGVEEGQPTQFVAMLASDSIRQHSKRAERDDLQQAIAVPTSDGVVEVARSLFIHPLVFRGQVRRALKAHAEDKVEKRCGRECVNAAVGGILAPSVGGQLWLEDGKMNPDAVGPLLEKAWVDPSGDLLGVPSRSWYAIFKPTIRGYISVHAAIEDADPAKAGEKLATLEDRKEIAAFYTTFAGDLGLAEKTGLSQSEARAIAGWWLRRYADGTAALFAAQIPKLLEGYDPEFKPGE